MKKHLPMIITVVVVGLLAFYGGIKLGESKNGQANLLGSGNFRQQAGQQGGQNANFARRGGQTGNFINGQILSSDDKSITIKLSDGGSKIVFFSDATKIVKSTDTNAADLTQGTTVMVNGTTNSDGSISATNIQIRPADAPNLQGPPADTQKPADSPATQGS